MAITKPTQNSHTKTGIVHTSSTPRLADPDAPSDTDEVIWIDWDEFTTVLNVHQDKSFSDKIQFLQSYFTPTSNYYQLWVTMDETREAYIKIALQESQEYTSNVFPEDVLSEQHATSYYYINGYEEDNPDAKLLI